MYQEYTISKINLLSDESGSAVLIDAKEKKIPIELIRTTKGTWIAKTGNNMVLCLLSPTGKELSTFKDFDSVFVNEAIPPDYTQ